MKNFENCTVYKLYCKDPEITEFYIGSTINLIKRLYTHKFQCKSHHTKLYKYINGIFLPDYGKVEADRVWCCKVEVRETDTNMAMRIGHRADNEDLG